MGCTNSKQDSTKSSTIPIKQTNELESNSSHSPSSSSTSSYLSSQNKNQDLTIEKDKEKEKRKSKDRYSLDKSVYKGARLGLILMCRDEFKSKYTQEILHKWRRVQIISVQGKRNEIIRIHYIGWPSQYDFDLNLDYDYKRLAPLYLLSVNVEMKGFELSEEEAECTLKYFKEGKYDKSKNKSKPPPSDNVIVFDVDAYLDVLDIFYRKGSTVQVFKWRRAKIISISGTKILINYIGWDSKFNETLDIEEDAHRLSPYGTKSVEDITRSVAKDQLKKNYYDNEGSNIDTLSSSTSPSSSSATSNYSTSALASTTTSSSIFSEQISQEEQTIIKMNEEEIRKEKEFIQILAKNLLHVIEIEGDGNCLFRSVSHQIYGNEDQHELLRERVVKHLISHKERFKLFCSEDYNEHVMKISCLGEWGDDLEIRALEEILDRNILIYSSGSPNPLVPVNYNEDEARLLKDVKPILLSYHGFRHYNSIVKDKESLTKEIRNSNVLLSCRIKLFDPSLSISSFSTMPPLPSHASLAAAAASSSSTPTSTTPIHNNINNNNNPAPTKGLSQNYQYNANLPPNFPLPPLSSSSSIPPSTSPPTSSPPPVSSNYYSNNNYPNYQNQYHHY